MSRQMDQAIQEIQQLPENDQDSLASIILQEIDSEQRWVALFARPESTELLSKLADQAFAEARAGRAVNLAS